jgi:F-type H+-transporting ATPase subunit a
VAESGSFHIDPISQFAISPLWELKVGAFNLSYTNSALFMSIAVALIALFFLIASRHSHLIPGRLQVAAEMAYEGIANIVRENGGREAMPYFPLIFSIFFTVLLGNVLGMIPGAFTYTSHIVVTFAMALALFVFITVLGFVKHGFHFLSRFLPPGVPVVMAPMIFTLEVISYFVRPVTLGVRLFANMMAGHMVLKVFAYFALGLLTSGSIGLMALGILPLAMNVAMIALELFVAVLQALIFTILTCVYLRDALVIEH